MQKFTTEISNLTAVVLEAVSYRSTKISTAAMAGTEKIAA